MRTIMIVGVLILLLSFFSYSIDEHEIIKAAKAGESDIKIIQITTHPGDEIEPQWSPDDTKISYGAVRGDNQNLGIVNIKNAEEELFTEGLTFLHATSWSPDGQKIAYVTGNRNSGEFISHVYIVSLSDKKILQLTNEKYIDGSPSWSPDGRWIAFPSNRNGNWNIWLKPVSGGPPEMITDHAALDHGPEWSPDGKYLAFHSYRRGNSDIWMIDISDRKLYQITDDKADDFYPDWSPDARYFVFESARSGNSDIWIKSRDGGTLIQVTSDPARDMRPSWSNDGNRIAFSSNRNGSLDVWIADISELWKSIGKN